MAKQACSNSAAATIGSKDINGLLKKPAYLNLPWIRKGSPNSTTLSNTTVKASIERNAATLDGAFQCRFMKSLTC